MEGGRYFRTGAYEKENIYKKDSSSFYNSLYPINMNKI